MKTIQINLYPFAELSEEAKEKALDEHRFINVDNDWWDSVYEDAKQAGLKITGFKLENGYYCNAEFIADAVHCAGKILDNHGKSTDTHKTALSFWTERDKIIDRWPRDENGEFIHVGDLDAELDRVEDDFLTVIRWAYHSLLIKEYNFQTGDQAVTETFEANDFHFTADGILATRLEKLTPTLKKNQS